MLHIEDKRLFLAAMIVNAQAEIAGMQAHDKHQEMIGETQFYTEDAYQQVCVKYGITHNQVIEWLRGG